jgi:hypothetical protein
MKSVPNQIISLKIQIKLNRLPKCHSAIMILMLRAIPVFLNHRDLKTFSQELGILEKLKNLSEIAKISSIFKEKVILKIYFWDRPQHYYSPGQKIKKSIYRDLDLKR